MGSRLYDDTDIDNVLTGSVSTYRITSDNGTFEIDLAEDNPLLISLVASGRHSASRAATPAKQSKGVAAGAKRQSTPTPDGYKGWAITQGVWTGKRPKQADVDRFLAQQK